MERPALVGLEVAVQLLGGLGDGAADPAGGLVAGDGQGASFAAQPGLAQGVGEQREGAGLVLDLADEEVDQAGFDDEPGLPGGSLDGGAQLVGGHGGEDVQPPLDQAGEDGVGGDVSHPVGPEHQDQWRGLGVVGEQLDEPVLLLVVVAQGEELFGLVDDEEPRLPGGSRWWEGADGVPAGGDDVAVLAFAAECGDEAGAHQGGLPGPGRAEDGEDAFGVEAFGAGADVAVAAEERLGRRRRRRASGRGRGRCRWPAPGPLRCRGRGPGAGWPARAPPDRGRGRRRARRRAGGGPGRWCAAPRPDGRRGTGRGRAAPTGAPAAVPRWPRAWRLGEHVAVVAGRDGRLEPPLLGVETELGEPGCFEAAGLPLLELGERATAPQGEGLGQRVRGTVGFAELEQLVAAGGERLELAGVDGVDGHGEPIARAGGRDRVGSEDLAQPHDAALQVLVPGRGRCVSPDHLGELVRAERLVPGRGQRGEDERLAGAQAGRRVVERERSQDRNTHASNVLAASVGRQPRLYRIDTGWARCRYRRLTEREQPGSPGPGTSPGERHEQPLLAHRYSLNRESSRWWWPSAAAGAAATLAVVAIVGSSSAGNAIPVDTDHHGTPAEVIRPASRRTPDGGASIRSQDDIPPGFRQCFMWQSHWNEAMDGPQPWCPIDPPKPRRRPGQRWSPRQDSAGRGAAVAGNLSALSLRRAELVKWVPIP